MSFILDALRKADAERQLGTLPDIHAQMVSGAPQPADPPLRRSGMGWMAAAALAVAIGALAWWMAPHRGNTPSAGLTAPAAAPTPASLPATAAKPATDNQGPPSRTPPPPQIAAEVPVPPPLPKPAAKPEKASTPKVAAEPNSQPVPKVATERKPAPAPVSAPAPTPAPAPAPAAATAAPPNESQPALALADLPPALRQELPPLAIHGSMYSDNPANRLLLVDKRLLHEGDEIAPGLTVESVMPRAAMLRYKGYRFKVGY